MALEALETVRHKIDSYQVNVCDDVDEAITAIREALAQPEQEPVAWQERKAKRMHEGVVTEWTNWYPCRYRTIDEAKAEACDHIPYEWRPLYTTPPQPEPVIDKSAAVRIATSLGWKPKRKPLTDEEIDKLPWEPHEGNPMTFAEGLRYFARAIEAAHGIKE